VLRLALLLIPLLLVAPLPGEPSEALAQSMGEEAERQLAFARRELAEGKYERAVKSAESALRLNPALYEALLVKALALEGLGDKTKAQALIVTYQELAGEQAGPEAAQALERMQSRKRRGRRGRTSEGQSTGPQVTPESVDGEAVGQKVQEAIQAGDCASAVTAAQRWTEAEAANPDSWLAAGHAHRCAGSFRPAVRAYRRYRRAGGADTSVPQLIAALEASLATLVVEVDLGGGSHLPALGLVVEGEGLGPDFWADNVAEFRDLPPGVELVIGVAGRGVKLLSQEVEQLGPGERRRITLEPEWIGLGRVEAAAFDQDACRVTVSSRDGEQELSPGQRVEVTAGLVSLVVHNEHGSVETQYELTAGQSVRFDPAESMPVELTVAGLPSGSLLRVIVEGTSGRVLEKEHEVPVGGRLERETGVLLAEPQRIRGLLPGSGGLWVEHPVLGDLGSTVILGPGVNGASIDWRSMPKLGDLTASYGTWQEEDRIRRRKVAAAPVPTAVLAIAGGVASGVLVGLALSGQEEFQAAQEEYLLAVQEGRPWNAEFADMNDARRDYQTFFIAAGASGGVAVVGVGLSVAIGAGAKQRLPEAGWRPEGF